MLLKRIKYLEQFCEAREALTAGNGDQMAEICAVLVDSPGVEEAIRLGDVFASLIEHEMGKSNVQLAHQYLEKMKKKKIIVTPYLDQKMIEDIYKGMGMPVPVDGDGRGKAHDDIDEDIQEDF